MLSEMRTVHDAAPLVAAIEVSAHPEVGAGKTARRPDERLVVAVVGDERLRLRPSSGATNQSSAKVATINSTTTMTRPTIDRRLRKTPRSITVEAAFAQRLCRRSLGQRSSSAVAMKLRVAS